jgi:glycosyltransferase involved in cell wall biosynthesis
MGQAKHRRPLTVTVVIPTIPPREHLLDRAVASVQAQTRKADTVMVSLDAEGLGAGPNRNRAWKLATTDYVAFLDDDDEFLPNHLALCMSAAKATGADVIYPWFELVGWDEATPERPDPLATMHNRQLVHPLGVSFGAEQARHLRNHAWIPATIVIRRTMLEKVGGYPAPNTPEWHEYNGCEDWVLLLRALDAGAKFHHVPYRTWRCHHGNGTAGRPWREQDAQLSLDTER